MPMWSRSRPAAFSSSVKPFATDVMRLPCLLANTGSDSAGSRPGMRWNSIQRLSKHEIVAFYGLAFPLPCRKSRSSTGWPLATR